MKKLKNIGWSILAVIVGSLVIRAMIAASFENYSGAIGAIICIFLIVIVLILAFLVKLVISKIKALWKNTQAHNIKKIS